MSNQSCPICQSFEVNTLCFRLIDCYLSKKKFPANYQRFNLKDVLYQTLREVFLSEIEIVGWLILLDEIGLKNGSVPQKLDLLYTALKAKAQLGVTVHREILKLQSKYPTLMKDFQAWSIQNTADGLITTPKLGKRFRELNLPYSSNILNYNFYVDYILGSTPVYNSYVVSKEKDAKKRRKVVQTHVQDPNFIDEREFERIDGY